MGVEPTPPFGASDFESARHLVSPVFYGVFFGLLTFCAPRRISPSSVALVGRRHGHDHHERHRHALVSLGDAPRRGRDHAAADDALEPRGALPTTS